MIKPYQRYRVVATVRGNRRAYIKVCGKRFLCEEEFGVEYIRRKNGRHSGFPFRPYRRQRIVGDHAYLVDAMGIIWVLEIFDKDFSIFMRPCQKEGMYYIWQHDPETKTLSAAQRRRFGTFIFSS